MKERVWVNFKELRARLRFDEVLRLYDVEVRAKGEQHHGPCPLPGHTGSRQQPCFSANLKRGIFHCFGCGAKGNVLEFAVLMEKGDLKDGDAIRRVAVALQQRFFPEGASRRHPPQPEGLVERSGSAGAPSSETLVNAPMDFELKGLDRNHEYFARHSITSATADYFGLGHCLRGFLKDRIAIPLHDAGGRLIGYAGGLVDEASATDENPLYRFPARRERDGRTLEFDRSAFLYNGHRIKGPCDDLIVVEWFPSAWWLHQCGFPHTVALMGSASLERQADLIVEAVKPSGRVWILPDSGKNGEDLAVALLTEISPIRFVRWVKIGGGHHLTGMKAEELKACFAQ